MTKIICYLLLFLCFSCDQNSENTAYDNETVLNKNSSEITNSDLRKFSISEEEIKKGLVKEYKETDVNGTRLEYKLIKSISDTIIREEFNSSFETLSLTKFLIQENSYHQIEHYSMDDNGHLEKFKITKPLIISFDSKDSVLLSEFSFLYDNDRIVYQEMLTRRAGIEQATFNGDTIDCIRIELLISLNDQSNPSNRELLSPPAASGYRLEAPGIGVFYNSMTYSYGTIIYELARTLTIDEFEELRLESTGRLD